MKAKIVQLTLTAKIPTQAHEGDVGFDVRSDETQKIPAGGRKLFKTGLAIQPEPGYEIQVRSRSGMALKQGVIVLNSPGTIEPTYTGEIGVILYNTTDKEVAIYKGDRIAQLVFKEYEPKVDFEVVRELSETGRGNGGFGSSGAK